MAFCRTLGHAIFHTAGTIGPSTMERSNARPPFDAGTATAGKRAAGDAVAASAAEAGLTMGRSDNPSVLAHRFQDPPHVGMGEHDGGLALERLVVAVLEPFASLGRRGQKAIDLFGQHGCVGIGRGRVRLH